MESHAHIDRIESGRAVLVLDTDGRETVALPQRLLPEGAREGDRLLISLSAAPDDTMRTEVGALLDDLFAAGSS